MGLFDFFSKRKSHSNAATPRSVPPNQTLCLCHACGSPFDPLGLYCPQCGMPVDLYENDYWMQDRTISVEELYFLTDAIEATAAYLEKIGRSDEACKLFEVKVCLPSDDKPIPIELHGACRSHDALGLLQKLRLLGFGGRYYFTDWPNADPAAGPICDRVSACVCELPQRIYHIEEIVSTTPAPLYGCPSAFELPDHALQKTIEVIDYAE